MRTLRAIYDLLTALMCLAGLVSLVVVSVLVLTAILTGCSANAATYHVSTGGSDVADGSSGTPWLTIQKALNTVGAGDTVIVAAGDYAEHADTVTAGGASTRITLQTSGTVNMRGFEIDQPYYTVDGFNITDYSPTSIKGAVNITSAGDYAIVKNCTFNLDAWVSSASVVFDTTGTGTITVAAGGFTAAGFRAGSVVYVGRNSSAATPLNNGDYYTVASMTDTVLTLSDDTGMQAETVSAILSGTYAYGLQIANGATNCLAHSNTFTDQAAPWVWMSGTDNTLTRNTFASMDGWDAIVYSGTDNIVSWNKFTGGSSTAYNSSPDVFEHWSAITSTRILFAHNYVDGWDGVIGIQKNSTIGDNGEVDFIGNVFANTGRLVIKMPNCRVISNTFYKVAYEQTTVRSSQDHALFFDDSAGAIDGTVVQNNVFVGCGEAAAATKGWYLTEAGQSVTTDYNFVAGLGSGYAAKTGFAETNGTNGGDPTLINVADPDGADNVVWTNDDGLAPNTGSPLLSTSHDGIDRGAYQVGSTFWVSPRGSDAAAGTAAAPWLTLTYAENQITAGESLFVDYGDYDERVTANNNGTLSARILYYSFGGQRHTKGGSASRGWTISGDYMTMDGLEITGAISNDALRGFGADYGILRNFYVHDTTTASYLNVVNLVTSGSDKSPAAGPQGWVISDFVVDNAARSIFEITGANHTIERNDVSNLREDFIRFFGSGHIIRNNIVRNVATPTTGHPDCIQSWGQPLTQNQYSQDVLIEDNIFINEMHYSTATSVSFADNGASPDTITRATGSFLDDGFLAGHNLTIWNATNSSNNRVDSPRDIATVTATVITLEADETLATSAGDSTAILMANSTIQQTQIDDPSTLTSDIILRNNIFYQIDGGGTADFINMTWQNNVFYNNAWISGQVITVGGDIGTSNFRNNVFLGSGRIKQRTGIDPVRGWYGLGASHPGVIDADYNYVASSNYAAKDTDDFTETHGVNGGDPMFLDESDPLGPDGIAWTADDGFQLTTGSPLIGAGEGGVDIGAYAEAVDPGDPDPPTGTTLNATTTTAGTVTVQ